MAKTKKVWAVIYTHFDGKPANDQLDYPDVLIYFGTEAKALEFCKGRTHHGQPAEATLENVPVHIASRWTIY